MKYFLSVFAFICLGILALALGIFDNKNVSDINPFIIGQTVYPAKNFSSITLSKDLVKMASEGAVVINLTKDLIRVRFINGDEETYAWPWFVAKEKLVLTDEWIIGNQFVVGQCVRAIPSSVREDFPDKGIVVEVDKSWIRLKGYDGWINAGHFQRCQ